MLTDTCGPLRAAGKWTPRKSGSGSPLDHPGRLVPVLPFVELSGITLLGVPIDYPGSMQRTSSHWATTVDKTICLLDRLRLFPDGQVQHALLRYCLDACRVVHLQRSTVAERSGSAPQNLRDVQPKTFSAWA